ncbi:MAG: glycosyltransferase family 4 protein [Deltaproteobacteria bacterium]|nr:glycosyltransferase family 4 protein [Deltaproteobacteria bacterium]
MTRLFYPFSEPLPMKKARAIQYLKTCRAAAECGLDVVAMAPFSKGVSAHECISFYGISGHELLALEKVTALRSQHGSAVRFSFNGVFNVSCLLRLMRHGHGRAAVMARHIKLAYFLLRFKKCFSMPFVFEAHEIFFSTAESETNASRLRAMEEYVYRNSDALISITEGLKKDIMDEFSPSAPFFVIPDAADVWSQASWRIERLGDRRVFYIGSLYPWKGVDFLVKAMAYIPNATLDIVGGEEADIRRLKGIALETGIEDRVFFHGWVPHAEVKRLLCEASVAVVPLGRSSIAERHTSPLKVFEYMASALPIVASDISSIREVLSNNDNAVLVQPEDPIALARGVERVLSDSALAQRISTRAYADSKTRGWHERGKRLSEVISAVVKGADG